MRWVRRDEDTSRSRLARRLRKTIPLALEVLVVEFTREFPHVRQRLVVRGCITERTHGCSAMQGEKCSAHTHQIGREGKREVNERNGHIVFATPGNYSSRKVGSNKSPVKWQHRRRSSLRKLRPRTLSYIYTVCIYPLCTFVKSHWRCCTVEAQIELTTTKVSLRGLLPRTSRCALRRENVNLALTHYARSGWLALGVRCVSVFVAIRLFNADVSAKENGPTIIQRLASSYRTHFAHIYSFVFFNRLLLLLCTSSPSYFSYSSRLYR